MESKSDIEPNVMLLLDYYMMIEARNHATRCNPYFLNTKKSPEKSRVGRGLYLQKATLEDGPFNVKKALPFVDYIQRNGNTIVKSKYNCSLKYCNNPPEVKDIQYKPSGNDGVYQIPGGSYKDSFTKKNVEIFEKITSKSFPNVLYDLIINGTQTLQAGKSEKGNLKGAKKVLSLMTTVPTIAETHRSLLCLALYIKAIYLWKEKRINLEKFNEAISFFTPKGAQSNLIEFDEIVEKSLRAGKITQADLNKINKIKNKESKKFLFEIYTEVSNEFYISIGSEIKNNAFFEENKTIAYCDVFLKKLGFSEGINIISSDFSGKISNLLKSNNAFFEKFKQNLNTLSKISKPSSSSTNNNFPLKTEEKKDLVRIHSPFKSMIKRKKNMASTRIMDNTSLNDDLSWISDCSDVIINVIKRHVNDDDKFFLDLRGFEYVSSKLDAIKAFKSIIEQIIKNLGSSLSIVTQNQNSSSIQKKRKHKEFELSEGPLLDKNDGHSYKRKKII